jgi:hypothetical protein
MCFLTDYFTGGFHGSLYFKANAGMDFKAVAMYDSSSSLKRTPMKQHHIFFFFLQFSRTIGCRRFMKDFREYCPHMFRLKLPSFHLLMTKYEDAKDCLI